MRISPTLMVEAQIAAAKRQLAALQQVRAIAISRIASWPNCPDCEQSATGVYAGRVGCFRCGWSA